MSHNGKLKQSPAPPAAGAVRVKALVDVVDNGVRHKPGETFEMEASLVAAHERAGQVEPAGG